MPLTDATKRRIEAISQADHFESVLHALQYASEVIGGEGVAYEPSSDESRAFSARYLVSGVSYVKRSDPSHETVGYDYARKEFLWQYRPPSG